MFFYKADFIPVLKNLTEAFRPAAVAHQVHLDFQTDYQTLWLKYDPLMIIQNVSLVMNQVINNSPAGNRVQLTIPLEQNWSKGMIQIELLIKGACLSFLEDILRQTITKDLKIRSGGFQVAVFSLYLPIVYEEKIIDHSNMNLAQSNYKHQFLPFHKLLETHLDAHFKQGQIRVYHTLHNEQQEMSFLQKVRTVINDNLEDESFDQRALSQALALSRSQLYRRLKRLINQSPSQYIRSLRLHKARELLRQTDLSVGEICFRMGFHNISHFTRAFRNKFEFTPSEYRQTNKGLCDQLLEEAQLDNCTKMIRDE